MAAKVLFIQGAGAGAHAADAAVAAALEQALGDGFRVVFPRLPDEVDPQPEAWKRAIAELARSSEADLLMAHSAGAAIVADLLIEGRGAADLPHVQAAFLLAPPYVGEGGWDFGGYHLDAHREQPPAPGIAVFFYFGEADETVPVAHASLYRQVFPQAVFRRLPHCGHQFDGHLRRVARDLSVTARVLGLVGTTSGR